MKTEIKRYLTAFFERFDYPHEARVSLLAALDKAWCEELEELIRIYDKQLKVDYKAFVEQMKAVSQRAGIHPFEGNLLLPLCLVSRMEKYYAEYGYSATLFEDTVKDFRYKLYECKDLHGVWGSCIAMWFRRLLMLEIFGFGKLLFELREFGNEYQGNGRQLTKESLVVAVHIPRTGEPLDRESKNRAYKAAKAFYQPYFGAGKEVPFTCSSWLLFPRNKEFLKPTSNLRAFMDDYDIFAEREYENYEETWRIFNKVFTRWEDMPKETSLQRAYLELIKRGEKTGSGSGVYFL